MNCKICNKKIKNFNLNKIPLVNNFNKNKKLYANGFAYCSNCDLGFNTNFIKDNILYNKSYLYDGNFNPNKIKIFSEIIKIKKNFKILEIGGGNGFIGKFITKKNKNASYLNLDPSSKGGFKTKKIFLENYKSLKKYDLIICLNVLAHVSNPSNLLQQIKKLSHLNTQYIFMVQNGLKEIKDGFLDNIYHEHKYYYSTYSISKFLKKLNLKNNYFYKINLHGESILFSNKKINNKLLVRTNTRLKFFNKINFIYIQKKYEKKIKNFIKILFSSNNKAFLIGCAPRTIKLLYDISKKMVNKIDCIYEPKNSRKIGLTLPGIKIRIKSENINDKNLNIWMPYHIQKPKPFEKFPLSMF